MKMNIIMTSEKKKCASCRSRSTNNIYEHEYCGIAIHVPLCDRCQKYATIRLFSMLRPLAKAASECVVSSYMLGRDEKTISEYQRKEREANMSARAETPEVKP